MELVYLWVEDYKNIHKQGFNFSPRFECTFHDEYDEEGKLKDGCELEIIEKKEDEYIKDFFGENINVTAIVGKNGSGKSNILESLIHLSLDNVYNKQKKLIYSLYVENNKYYISTSLKISSKVFLLQSDKTFLMYYDYSLSSILFDYDEIDKDIIDNSSFSEISEEQHYPLIMQPLKSANYISIGYINKKAMDYMLEFNINNSVEFENIKNFFQPIYFKLSFEYKTISGDESLYEEDNPILRRINNFHRLDNFVSEFYRDELIDLTIFYILQTTFNKSREFSNDFEISEDFKKQWYEEDDVLISFTKRNINKLMNYIKMYDYKDLYLKEELEIEKNFKFINFLKKQDKNFFIDNRLYTIQDNKNLLKNLATWINIELFDSNQISFYDLSFGEKFLIKFIYNLLYHINILNQLNKYKNITLLLDELEQGLHPEWQKKFLDLLIMILKTEKSFNFNIICATHSPFILSDLPKKNIFFLDNGKQSKGVKHEQTFGANIHTLLSDSFFMEDGLMGEFAKGKINEIKEFYEKVKLEKKTDENVKFYNKHKKKFWEIQKIIGEAFLQTVIKNYLDELELLFSDDNTLIEKELADIEKRKAYLESLKNA